MPPPKGHPRHGIEDGPVSALNVIPESDVPPWGELVAKLPQVGQPGLSFRDRGDGTQAVVLHDDQGSLIGAFQRNSAGGFTIGVRPDWRGRGVASQLARAAEERWGTLDFTRGTVTEQSLRIARQWDARGRGRKRVSAPT